MSRPHRHRKATRAFVAMIGSVAFLAAFQTSTAAQAHAATTNDTVMATTQRMSSATLNSRQNGAYAAGRHPNLVCYTRGQSVKGYFSKWISGGWDNLWYRTGDGYWIADVDIQTASSGPVGPQCPSGGSTAPAPASTKAQRAVSWAIGQVGSDSYLGMCGQFVANAYGTPHLGYKDAITFYYALNSAGQIHGGAAPAGALVFSRSSWDLGHGHVDIAVGDGTYVSGGVGSDYGSIRGHGHNVQLLRTWNPSPGAQYLGWAYAPASWPGR
ncbi:hypothetical protein FEZ30_15680 [Acidipropionibacterium acidipropionici]|nr:hypothetical protein FEZ30_15680 [Acidipropionibacterium acidipropionici]